MIHLRAIAALTAATVGIRLFSLPRVVELLVPTDCATKLGVDSNEVRDVIEAWGRRLPFQTCLTRGVAARVLLSHYGLRSVLRLGVRRTSDGRFHAHAWVTVADEVVVGAIPNLAHFSAFPRTF
ncbi:MAG: lasso peptide biosynthesis B2 protein [Myxococcales bacterium]|nr:lasso peptide biosynthesis B2 protein [Myxococcales bacterium]